MAVTVYSKAEGTFYTTDSSAFWQAVNSNGVASLKTMIATNLRNNAFKTHRLELEALVKAPDFKFYVSACSVAADITLWKQKGLKSLRVTY